MEIIDIRLLLSNLKSKSDGINAIRDKGKFYKLFLCFIFLNKKGLMYKILHSSFKRRKEVNNFKLNFKLLRLFGLVEFPLVYERQSFHKISFSFIISE